MVIGCGRALITIYKEIGVIGVIGGYSSPVKQLRRNAAAEVFAPVRAVGLTLPDVRATTKYDGSPVLKVRGIFMAGLAMHRSAEPDTLVVRVALDEREWLFEDAPDIYYITDYYRPYPLVLVRLARVDRGALHDLLSVSRRLALEKARKPRVPISPATR